MKRWLLIGLLLTVGFLLCGCHQMREEGERNMSEIQEQIHHIEQCLSIDLEDIPDDYIQTVYEGVNTQGNRLRIQYIDLEGAGDVVEPRVARSPRWTALPVSAEVENILSTSGAYDQYGLESITEGYYTIHGVETTGEERTAYDIGIWDSWDETLYYVSITRP